MIRTLERYMPPCLGAGLWFYRALQKQGSSSRRADTAAGAGSGSPVDHLLFPLEMLHMEGAEFDGRVPHTPLVEL